MIPVFIRVTIFIKKTRNIEKENFLMYFSLHVSDHQREKVMTEKYECSKTDSYVFLKFT